MKKLVSYYFKALDVIKKEGLFALMKLFFSKFRLWLVVQSSSVLRPNVLAVGRVKAYLHSTKYADYNPYSYVETLKPVEIHVVSSTYAQAKRIVPFSLVATVLNEETSAAIFIESLARQSWIPDEIIVVDGGSTDKTVEIIESSAAKFRLNVRLIKSPGASIASGRNLAIQHATNELIIVVDAGCELDSHLCRSLIGTLSDFPNACLVGGIYHGNEGARYFIPEWETNDWTHFLPSSRNVLIRKHLWKLAGGYPEFLSKTGEDTLFDIWYRRHSHLWVFNKSAVVFWHGPRDTKEALRLAYSYGYGDGESGVGDARFYSFFKRFVATGYKPSKKHDILLASAAGYLDGRQSRPQRELSGRNLKGLVIILSGVPMTDSGGGQRGAQLALEFARQGLKVIYANVYPSFETPHRVWFDVDLTLIELYHLCDLELSKVLDAYEPLMDRAILLLEFPHPDFLPLIQEAKRRRRRPKIIYDLIDNWGSSLGWTWYTREVEDAIINYADHLVASASTLQEELAQRTGRPVKLIPNAFNAALFHPARTYQRPSDLPEGFERIVLYVGALWGEWFDWDLLNYAVSALPDTAFVLVGNSSPEIQRKVTSHNKNVFFLGLQPQHAIPAYLAFADVCIIPFKTDHITRYVNPLKVYEYLAMRKPVVATAIEELTALPGIQIVHSPQEFVEALRSSPHLSHPAGDYDKLLREHTWRARTEALLELVR